MGYLHAWGFNIISDIYTEKSDSGTNLIEGICEQQGKRCEVHIRKKGTSKGMTMKGVMKFGKKGKLRPRYIGPFQVLKGVGL